MIFIGLAVFLVTGAVNLQLPLYGIYAENAGLTSGGMALLLAGYVAALLGVLLFFGGAADTAGRKPVVLLALASAAMATLIVWTVPGAWALAVARWFQGAGVALVMGAATAWLTELSDAQRAASVTGFTSTAGFAMGAVLTSLFLFAGYTPLSFPLWLFAIALTAGGLLFVPSAAPTGPKGAKIQGPEFPKGTLLPSLSILLGWSIAGIVVAVVPGVLRSMGADQWSGVTLFALLLAGSIAQSDAKRRTYAQALFLGRMILGIGAAVIAFGVQLQQPLLVVVGAMVAGTSTHGWLYVGGLSKVGELAPGSSRAVSGYFMFAYIGFGIPAVFMGAAVDQFGPEVAFWSLAALTTLGAIALSVASTNSHRQQRHDLG